MFLKTYFDEIYILLILLYLNKNHSTAGSPNYQIFVAAYS